MGTPLPCVGQSFRRPQGQTKAQDADAPSMGPTRRLDYELEMAIFVASPNPLGAPIAMALNHTFKVHSGNHRLEGRLVDRTGEEDPGSATDCQITISGVSGTEPIVEARHNNGQRRYIISNAPTIGKVEVNAVGAPQTFNVPGGTIYTVLILN